MRARALALAASAILGACDGAVGIIQITPVAAPESDLLGRIESARLTLTDPDRVVEAERDEDGRLALDVEVDAGSAVGFVELEGFDAAGERIAFGRTGPLPVAAIDAEVDVYLAPPQSMAAAPVSFGIPRTEIGAAPLSFGALLAGGRGASGEPRDELVIYSVYDHEFQEGERLPSPRAGPIVFPGPDPFVYIFGGLGQEGSPTSSIHRFDTSAPPMGDYVELSSSPELARAGADAAPLGADRYLVTGDPLVRVDGVLGAAARFPDAPPLEGEAVSVELRGAVHTLVAGEGAGSTGAVLLAEGDFTELDAPPEVRRRGHTALVLPGGDVLLAGGERAGAPEPSAVLYDPEEQSFEVLPEFLAVPRTGAAIAAAGSRLVVAGGEDAGGALTGDVEVFDALSLEPVGSVPMVVPRTGAAATPLQNGQVLIAGGTGESGQPVEVLELFTPGE